MKLINKIHIYGLILPGILLAIFFIYLSKTSDALGFLQIILGPFLLAPILLWPLAVILFAKKTKTNGTFSISGIRPYHVVLSIIMLVVFALSALSFPIMLRNWSRETDRSELFISMAENAQTLEEINDLYYNKLNQIEHPYWQSLLLESLVENKNTPAGILEEIYNKNKMNIGGVPNVKLDEAFLKNTSTPDYILLELTSVPLVPGRALDTAENIRKKAVSALTSRGYICKSYFSAEERKSDGEIWPAQLLFKCSR